MDNQVIIRIGLISLFLLPWSLWGQTADKILTKEGEILGLDGTVLKEAPTSPMFDVRFSPDRTKMVFMVVEDIWVVDADGSNLKELTDGEAIDRNPYWSPDGTKIVFERFQPEGHPLVETTPDLYVMNADGSNLVQLTTLRGDELNPTWSPDGMLIAFDAFIFDTSERQIFTINADGTDLVQLTHLPGRAQRLSWTPDSRQIAFMATDGETRFVDIYLMNQDGSGITNLTNQPGAYNALCWSPDGSRLAYSTKRNNQWGIYSIKTDGTDEQLMIDRDVECSLWFWDNSATVIKSNSWGLLKGNWHKIGR